MEVLTEEQVTQIIGSALANNVPEAEKITLEEFCGDCPRRSPDCFPCKTAQRMVELRLFLIVAERAVLN